MLAGPAQAHNDLLAATYVCNRNARMYERLYAQNSMHEYSMHVRMHESTNILLRMCEIPMYKCKNVIEAVWFKAVSCTSQSVHSNCGLILRIA